jgi:hypothetical protein
MRKGLQFIVPVLLLQCLFMNVMMAERISAQNMYEVTLTVKAGNPSLRDLFKEIENQTDFTLSYSSVNIDLSQLVAVAAGPKNLGSLLDAIGQRHHLLFKQLNTVIMVKAESKKVSTVASGSIRGTIVDSLTNEVLPGATISIRGTSVGTSTDVNGAFLLRVPSGDVEIEVSYIGFRKFTQVVSIPADGITEVQFKLQSDVTMLKDVVVTGTLQGQQRALNQQKSADNIKNIVSADQIGRFPDPNVAEALQRVPAVNIERDQGEGRYVLVR